MIDIIIPAYNCQSTLGKTLSSLVAQTDDNFEVIVSVKDIKTIIKEQPTAYDVDKVVKELESHRNEITCDVDIDKAIEIVKQGGVNRWKDYWSFVSTL